MIISYTKRGNLETRRFNRIDLDEPVGVHAGENYRVEKARQLSQGGMLIESNRDFILGQRISVTFQLSDTILVKLEAEVRYTLRPDPNTHMIGVSFLNSDEDQIRILLDYFQKRGSA